MPGLIPDFSFGAIEKRVNAFTKDKLKKMALVLSFVGLDAVEYARENGSYQDQTGNLRASVGYAVIYNGEITKQGFQGKADGVWEGKSVVIDLAEQYNVGMVLVVVAGMEYAAAVESLNYDVITGSTVFAEDLLQFLKQKLGSTFQ